MDNLVSVIMPCFNDEKFIAQAIESVLAQTYTLWEMIIADDASTDSSRAIISAYCAQDDRIKLLTTQQQSGSGKARNLAIQAATGQYIAFLDSDDIWLPEKLKKQIAFMQEKSLAFTYASYRLIDENDQNLGKFIVQEKTTYTELLKMNDISCLTAIYDAHKLDKLYMSEIVFGQDYVLWLQILKRIKIATSMQEILAVYRIKKRYFLLHKTRKAFYRWHIYRKIEQLSLLHSCYYFLQYAYYGLIKYR